MAPWVECLLYKHEDLSSNPQHVCKKSNHIAYSLSTRESRQEEPETSIASQPSRNDYFLAH